MSSLTDVLDDVASERTAQDERWGEQNHPSLYGEELRFQIALQAMYWKEINDAREAKGVLAWDGILLEEVYEAIAERGDEAREIELIQVAAVAVAWVEAIRRARAAAVVEPAEDDEVAA